MKKVLLVSTPLVVIFVILTATLWNFNEKSISNLPTASMTAGAASAATPLPQSVYDDWANPNLSVINMPSGTFYLPGSKTLVLNRSNVTVNFAGCTLLVDPAESGGGYPISVVSTSLRTPSYSSGRYISHLTGQITQSTTQLTMDPNEIVDVQVGETVLIWAGVTPRDPVEAESFIPATVASVDSTSGVITFTQPLGKNITNYGSVAGLLAVTDPTLQWKVGTWGGWPNTDNFSKGYGVDHGMERFVGGMIHDVTFNNPTLNLDIVTSANAPNGMMEIYATAVKNFTVNNLSINNPFQSGVHLWRSFDSLINGVTLTGTGISRNWNTVMSEAAAFTVWGGDRMTFRNVTITSTDTVVFNTEVNPEGIWLDGLNYDVTFTSARTFQNSSVILGFFFSRDAPRVTNATIKAAVTGGSTFAYASYEPIVFDGYLRLPGSSLPQWFDFGYQKKIKLNGTVTIGGVQYGPAVTTTVHQNVIHGASFRDFVVPKGLYTSLRLKVINSGDLLYITDSYGNSYSISPSVGWQEIDGSHWYGIQAGDSELDKYMKKQLKFSLNNSGSTADASVDVEMTYLPVSGSPAPTPDPTPPPPPPVPTPDTTLPVVSITAPASGATVAGSVSVTSTATDNVGVVGVQFKLDGANLGSEDLTSPYSITWDSTLTSNGSHTITVVARDTAGNTKTATNITVTVSNTVIPPVDTTLPVVSITSPASGASITVGSSISLSATASDNVGVVGVQFKLDGANLGSELTTAPYSGSWNTTSVSNGSHTLTAAARDAAGNTRTSSAITITVNALPTIDTTSPTQPGIITTSSITQTGVVLSWPVSTDNVGVSAYKVFRDGTLIASPVINSYAITNLSPGTTYTFTVQAYDAALNVSTASLPASITTSVNPVVTYSLVVSKSGVGTITGSGLNCGSTCSISLSANSNVTLTAIAASGYSFSGWSGSCTGFGFCNTTISGNTTVTATFTQIPVTTSPPPVFTPTVVQVPVVVKTPVITGSVVTKSGSPIAPIATNVVTKTLNLGMNDSQVKLLQQTLNKKGYLIAVTGTGSKGKESNYFGLATEKAVKRFQCAKLYICLGLPKVNGYGQAGPKTRAALILSN